MAIRKHSVYLHGKYSFIDLLNIILLEYTKIIKINRKLKIHLKNNKN